MTMHRNDTTARGVVLLALLLGLAACGGGGSSSDDGPDTIADGIADAMDGICIGGDAYSGRFLATAEPVGAPARICLRTMGSTAVLWIEHDADRTPAELELTLGLDEALVEALASVEVEDTGCETPDVSIAIAGNDLTVRIAHPEGTGAETDAATQEIRLEFEGVEAAGESISILWAGAVDDEGRPIPFTVVPTGS